MYIMGALHKVSTDSKRSRYGERKRTRYEYKFEANNICRTAFLTIYDIGERTLKNLIRHVNTNGNVPRVHGNKGKKPYHALSFVDIEKVVKFIFQFAQENGLPQPAAPRGRDDTAPVFLPAYLTKTIVHTNYAASCEEANVRLIKISAFLGIWSQCCSHIKIATPEDDVCAKCETLRKNVNDARTDDDKLQASTDLQEHILAAKIEHQVYKECVSNSREEFRDYQISDIPVEPCSQDYEHVHYTFDFSQNVAVPHHARQMGPLYFVTPRKVHLFGFRDDGTPRQYNYLIDESQTMVADGKGIHGPDAIISMVDHAMSNYTHGEKKVTIHADNCGGQNKNRYVLAYFCWRTMVGLNKDIRYCMQIPGHARCLIDAGFAHIKKLYRRTDCETLADIEQVVNKSAYSNIAVMYRHGDEETTWNWRSWKAFLSQHYKALVGIRSYQQFRFSSQDPGCVFTKKSEHDTEVKITLMKDGNVPHVRPGMVPAAGLTHDRSRYLATHVRQYLREVNKDITCPLVSHEE